MELNREQLEAAEYSGKARNILVNAGAGCGKTRTIIARAVHLINTGVDASKILMVTFTNRAAREMKVRLKSEVGSIAEGINAGTFHAFCLQVMSRIPKSFEVTGLNIIDVDDQNSLMKVARQRILRGEEKSIWKELPKPQILVKYLSYSRNTCQSSKEYLLKNTGLSEVCVDYCLRILEGYMKAKSRRGYLDFDDLLEIFASMLEKKPALRKAICDLFEEVLVDEMQDTNPLQFRILRSFSEERTRLFCVGDPAQSIYKFRGAEFKQVYRFTELFPDSIILPLSRNYRSNQEILDLSNWLLTRSPYEYMSNLIAHRDKADHLPKICDFDSAFDEASWVADEVQAFHESDVSYNDIMLLARTGYGAKPLEAEFIRRGIPYRFIGGTALTKSAHVRDVLSLLRVLRNNQDDLAWIRFLKLWPRIGERTAEKLLYSFYEKQAIDPIDIFAEQFGEGHEAVITFKKAAKVKSKPQVCVSAAIEGLVSILSDRYDKWEYRYQDLRLLASVAAQYNSLEQFVDAFTLEPLSATEVQRLENDEAVTVITVHSAKGTEADICFVIDAKQGVYPHARSFGDPEYEEEERRILYVAMTRAKNELIITRSAPGGGSFFMGNTPTEGEEYFLASVPDELINRDIMGWKNNQNKGLASLKDVF